MLVTHIILLLTIITSFYAFNDKFLFHRLAYSPYSVKHDKQWYRTFTHAFVHADFTHLLLNMFVLYQFGEALERVMKIHFGNMGTVYFIVLYLGGILFSTLISFARHQNNTSYLSVGASGAVSAVIFATILIHPSWRLQLVFLPIPMPGFVFGFLYLTAEIVMDRLSRHNIAHDAHLMGALFGMFYLSLIDIEILKRFIEFIKNYFS